MVVFEIKGVQRSAATKLVRNSKPNPLVLFLPHPLPRFFRTSPPPAPNAMNRTGNYAAYAREGTSIKMHAGQPPQRPPSLGPNPALGGPFRAPFPQYGIPPRNVMPGYPALPNHRTTQNVVPQPSPNYIQQRGQSGFPFVGGAMQQQQQSQQTSSQHASQTPLAHTSHQQQQPQTQQAAAATPSLPPHLAQNSAPSLGTAPSVSSASEVGLDLNDFPALGSTPTSVTTPSTTNATSYASQAGTGAGAVGNGAAAGGQSAQRDFTPDDFPALGGSTQSTQQPSAQTPQPCGPRALP